MLSYKALRDMSDKANWQRLLFLLLKRRSSEYRNPFSILLCKRRMDQPLSYCMGCTCRWSEERKEVFHRGILPHGCRQYSILRSHLIQHLLVVPLRCISWKVLKDGFARVSRVRLPLQDCTRWRRGSGQNKLTSVLHLTGELYSVGTFLGMSSCISSVDATPWEAAKYWRRIFCHEPELLQRTVAFVFDVVSVCCHTCHPAT